MCIVSLFCVKKTTKNKKMFIFYISLTLYKLFDDCQAENSGVFSDSCYFCKVCVARAVWQERAACSPGGMALVTRGCVLFTESSFLFLTWVSLWLQTKEPMRPWLSAWPLAIYLCGLWLLLGPIADSVASAICMVHGYVVPGSLGDSWLCGPWLSG